MRSRTLNCPGVFRIRSTDGHAAARTTSCDVVSVPIGYEALNWCHRGAYRATCRSLGPMCLRLSGNAKFLRAWQRMVPGGSRSQDRFNRGTPEEVTGLSLE